MKPRLIILFSLIVTIPAVTIVWLGISMSSREKAVLRDQYKDVLTQHLFNLKDEVTSKVKAIENELIPLTDQTFPTLKNNSLQQHPLVSQTFFLDRDRRIVYPDPNTKSLTEKEQSFLSRTAEVWESREVFYRPEELNQAVQQTEQTANIRRRRNYVPNDAPENSISQSYSNLADNQQALYSGSRKKSYITVFNKDRQLEDDHGWYSWFQGKGLNFILWRRTRQDTITGLELDRQRIIDSITAVLPNEANPGQSFILKNATGNLHRWGSYKPEEDELPITEVYLNAPLQSWKLCGYFDNSQLDSALSKTIFYNYILGGSTLGMLVGILCIYFYRENSRQLRESSQKVNFVNQVSHELKTPLTNIRMYAELLERNLDEENLKAQKQLGIIVSESQRLSRLIANVLSFAQKDKKALKLNLRQVEIPAFLQYIVNYFSPVLSRKSIEINLKPGENLTLKADSDALEQIFANLLSNVEKYVQEGGTVEVSYLVSDGLLKIIVTDNGPGIPRHQKQKIFDSFHRISNELSDGVSGTGIGLTISRELARLHGGDLTLIDSDSGASFQLSLPIQTQGEKV